MAPFSFDDLGKHDFKLKNAEDLRLQMLFKATKSDYQNGSTGVAVDVDDLEAGDVVECSEDELMDVLESEDDVLEVLVEQFENFMDLDSEGHADVD